MNAQEAIWHFVGPTFWIGYSIVCAIGAILLFRQVLRSVERNALTVARMVWLGGFIVGAFIPFNSGCQPLSAALFATSGAMMTVLLTVRWCDRPGTPAQKLKAIFAELLFSPRRNTRVDGD